jgi:hypothetical protein
MRVLYDFIIVIVIIIKDGDMVSTNMEISENVCRKNQFRMVIYYDFKGSGIAKQRSSPASEVMMM